MREEDGKSEEFAIIIKYPRHKPHAVLTVDHRKKSRKKLFSTGFLAFAELTHIHKICILQNKNT